MSIVECDSVTYNILSSHLLSIQSVTPTELDEGFQTVLVVFSYLGAGISIICLTILLTTYILSK